MLDFGHDIYTVGPPVEIERVDVPVRLEKRLAALLADLAEHKRMSLSSCLEEILVHTCAPLGDGVASPHTRSQLRHIQNLKEKRNRLRLPRQLPLRRDVGTRARREGASVRRLRSIDSVDSIVWFRG